VNYRVFTGYMSARLCNVGDQLDQPFVCASGERVSVVNDDGVNVYFRFVESGSLGGTFKMPKASFDATTVDGLTYEMNWFESLIDRG
jgi:hypothetical protein